MVFDPAISVGDVSILVVNYNVREAADDLIEWKRSGWHNNSLLPFLSHFLSSDPATSTLIVGSKHACCFVQLGHES